MATWKEDTEMKSGSTWREDPAEKGGRTALHSEKVSAAQFAMYLKGIDFPATRDQIVDCAKANGAPDTVIQLMNRLPEREYTRANEVEQEFGKMK